MRCIKGLIYLAVLFYEPKLKDEMSRVLKYKFFVDYMNKNKRLDQKSKSLH